VYRRIVLAYDGSLEGRVALREGALLSKRHAAKVYLLAVTPIIHVADALSGAYFNTEPHAQEVFLDGLRKAREIGLEVVGELVQGEASDEISAFARRVAADLVVVGHHRRSFLERWWAGPGQSALSDKLECSLLIARNPIDEDPLSATPARASQLRLLTFTPTSLAVHSPTM
jgi:nucleotide-binding universal stress UspA family protein